MKYTDRKNTPLKWHRFVQILILPLMILSSGFVLVSMFAELTGLPLRLPHFFAPLLAHMGADIYSLGSMFWPVAGTFLAVFVIFLLSVCAWVGFFSWRVYSLVSWILLLILLLAAAGFGFYAVNTWGIKMGIAAVYLQVFLGLHEVSEGWLTGLRIVTVIGLALQIIYTVLNIVYYIRRRKLFSAGEEEDDEPVIPHEPVKEVRPAPAAAPAAAQPAGWKCPKCGTVNTSRFCETCGERKPEERDTVVRANFMTLPETEKPVSIAEEPVSAPLTEILPEEPEAVPDEPVREGPVIIPEEILPEPEETEPEETAVIPEEVMPEPEEDLLPDDEEIELPESADDIVSDILKPQRKLKYCPVCGAELSDDADFFFCSRCGAKLE
ncbi:MAG: zinc ribbon domain-containing protein [Solobacterium sp.]|nr:zinc ribbon domain-containing protein [Solobacterium sp.]